MAISLEHSWASLFHYRSCRRSLAAHAIAVMSAFQTVTILRALAVSAGLMANIPLQQKVLSSRHSVKRKEQSFLRMVGVVVAK